MASEPVEPYFTRFLRVLIFCLGVSKIVILKENGVVNGVVECRIKCIAIVRTIVYNKKEDMYEKGVLLLWQSQQIYMLE